MRTVERRLAMMKTICRKRHVTMQELADEFGVSVRTVRRDVFELSFLMPIYTKTGRYDGGVYVCEDYRMDKMYMSDVEIALLMRLQSIANQQLNISECMSLQNIINCYTKPTVK